MKKFLIKSTVAVLIVSAIHIAVALFANGKSDAFYLRFTTPKQPSLIVGTSRAAQGVMPSILNDAFKKTGIALPMFNFAFTLAHSPYGPVYFRAIKKKLLGTSKGVHIISVSPWSISSTSSTPNIPSSFREHGQILDRVDRVNGSHPNWNYFFNFNRGWGALVTTRINYALTGSRQLHPDGWLEITVPMDNASVSKRSKGKVKRYSIIQPSYKFSAPRLSYLKKTAELLKANGEVFMVRIPISTPMFEIENRLSESFDQTIQTMADEIGIVYINLMETREIYQYTDGNHLYKKSSAVFTKTLAQKILDHKIGEKI